MNNWYGTLLPIVLIMLSGVISYFIGKKSPNARDKFTISVTLLATLYYAFVLFAEGHNYRFTVDTFFGEYSMTLGWLNSLYALITSGMWFVTTMFSTPYFKSYEEQNRYYLFSMITFGATLGVFTSVNLITLFIFFEIMSFASYVLVIHDRKEETQKAASTYLKISVFGGMALLLGICMYTANQNQFVYLTLIFLGFGAKAGAFPLQTWLPKAHPVAPAPASALLSGVLTKTGIFGLITVLREMFWHETYDEHGLVFFGFLLLIAGAITMVLGGVLALFSSNIKRTLACSSMSQIGFILTGISVAALFPGLKIGTIGEMGTVLHMVNHSLVKLILFVCAGIIYMNLHKLDLNKIKGFGRGKPMFMIIFLLASLNICGIPLFGGYVSKTLLHEGLVELADSMQRISDVGFYACKGIEYLFLFTGGLTVAYMAKLFVCLFIKRPDTDMPYKVKTPWYCTASLLFTGLLLPLIGTVTYFSDIMADYAIIGSTTNVDYYSLHNLSGSAISIGIGLIIYFCVVRTTMIKGNEFKSFNLGSTALAVKSLPEKAGKALFRLFLTLCHAISDLPDAIVLLFSKTVYKEVSPKKPDLHRAVLSSKIGFGLEKASEKLGVKQEKRRNLGLKFASTVEAMRITMRRITRNLSFSMIIACLGLCGALIFIFFII